MIVGGRDEARGQAVAAEIAAAGGAGDFVVADLGSDAGVHALAARASEIADGALDVLVNNAGVFPFGPTDAASEAVFDTTFAVNVKAPYMLVADLAPAMVARGSGSVVNITTMVAEFGAAGMGLYGSTKAALVLLTKSWAAEFGPSGVRVNAVSPGPTRTEGTAGMGDALDQLASAGPAGRPGSADEIADAVVYLATGALSFVHGAVLPVDGGRIAV